ncbi:MAG: MmcQ/YjbR family DNA-binding protein [Asticcacaulis sp.]
MVDAAQARQIAAALPGAADESSAERLGFSIDGKGFAWTFMQRDTPRQKRWPNLDVLAISCPLDRKELLIEAAPGIYFDDPHYRGYPAVLTRLPAIAAEELAERLKAAIAFQLARPKKRKR